jgi:hypothetical protein
MTDEDLRSYLIAHGRKNAMRYDWDETAANMQQIYELVFHPRATVTLPGDQAMWPRLQEWFKL